MRVSVTVAFEGENYDCRIEWGERGDQVTRGGPTEKSAMAAAMRAAAYRLEAEDWNDEVKAHGKLADT